MWFYGVDGNAAGMRNNEQVQKFSHLKIGQWLWQKTNSLAAIINNTIIIKIRKMFENWYVQKYIYKLNSCDFLPYKLW